MHVVTTKSSLRQVVRELRASRCFGLDTETTGTDSMRDGLVGISLSTKVGRSWYIPVGHDRGKQLSLSTVQRLLGPVLANSGVGKVFHNAKFDLKVLARHGLPTEGLLFDSLVAAWLLEPTGRGIGLKRQSWKWFGTEMTPIEHLIGKGQNQITMAQVPIELAAPYACADAEATLALMKPLSAELGARGQWSLFSTLEMPIVEVLTAMETRGIGVDATYLKPLSYEFATREDALRWQIFDLVGGDFNINSPQQLGRVLFNDLRLPIVAWTKTGPATGSDVLRVLIDRHPVILLILQYRQLNKLRTTYAEALPNLVNPATGRVHTNFRQTGTTTGRLSSAQPNLQNIPVRTDEGRRVRRSFFSSAGWSLVAFDYSQIEIRVLAHLSQDPELLKAFWEGEDVHTWAAALLCDIPTSGVSPPERALAKLVNFGVLYGISVAGLAARCDLSLIEAESFMEAYFGRFQGVARYMEETRQLARKQGYVETLLGRRRYFPELQDPELDEGRRASLERSAVNMPIQGSAADIIKIAMRDLHPQLQGLPAHMLLQVHDDLILEVRNDALQEIAGLVAQTMENAHKLDVPVTVDVKVGPNWTDLQPLKLEER